MCCELEDGTVRSGNCVLNRLLGLVTLEHVIKVEQEAKLYPPQVDVSVARGVARSVQECSTVLESVRVELPIEEERREVEGERGQELARILVPKVVII